MTRLECWVSCGTTYCADCADRYTGAKPVALLPPRTCAACKRGIVDPWPDMGVEAQDDEADEEGL